MISIFKIYWDLCGLDVAYPMECSMFALRGKCILLLGGIFFVSPLLGLVVVWSHLLSRFFFFIGLLSSSINYWKWDSEVFSYDCRPVFFSPFSSVRFCFIDFEATLLHMYRLRFVLFCLRDWLLTICKMHFFDSCNNFYLQFVSR